jgi:hypothetical protein
MRVAILGAFAIETQSANDKWQSFCQLKNLLRKKISADYFRLGRRGRIRGYLSYY